jgi:hypothetical protein
MSNELCMPARPPAQASCRARHDKVAVTGLQGAKGTRYRKELQKKKRQAKAGAIFTRINSCTLRMDLPSKKGAGSLMEVAGARQRWIARVGAMASEPLPLDQARRAAVAMLDGRRKKKAAPTDRIVELNIMAAAEVDRAALAPMRKAWPVDLMNGRQRGDIAAVVRRSILLAELGA